MSPSVIIEQALAASIDILALTDHNSCRNLPALSDAARGTGLLLLYGMELTTLEEAHCLCLFNDLTTALEWGEAVYQTLPEIGNDPDHFGDQPVVDKDENVIELLEKSLSTASGFSIDNARTAVQSRGGLFIPAHVDRETMSIYSQLGFIPDEPFDALEVSPHYLAYHPNHPDTAAFPLITGSDAHYPDDLGRAWTELDMPGRPDRRYLLQGVRNALHRGVNHGRLKTAP